MDKRLKYWLPYFFLWTFCYLFYPCWLVQGSPFERYIWLLLLFVYFVVFSVLYFKKAEVFDNGGGSCPILFSKKDFIFIGAVIIFVLLHIYPIIFLPLRTWTDEPSHACSGIEILKAISSELLYSSFKFEMMQWLLRFTVIVGVAIAFMYKPWKYLKRFSDKQKVILLMSIVFLFSNIAFFLLKNVPFYTYIYKPPPLSRWLSLAVATLCQLNVFWVRFPSLVFCILSSVLIYEIAAILGHKDLARIAAVIFLFFPNISYYSSSVVLGSGTVFFSLIPLYFLICFLKSKNYSSLHWCFFWAAAAFLWKRPLITLQIYIILILVLYYIFIERISLKKCFIDWGFSFAVILPFFLIGEFFIKAPLRSQKLETCVWFSSLFHIERISLYMRSMPNEISLVGLVLFCAGISFFIAQRSYFKKFWPLAISFLCWYIILTMALEPFSITHSRWQLPLYPFIAICAAFCFRFLINRWKKLGIIALSGFLLFMILCSTLLHFPALHKEYALYRTDFKNPTHLGGFLPYEEMIAYMKKHIPIGTKVMADDFPDPREFYSFKYHLNVKWELIKSHDKSFSSIDGLYKKAKLKKVSYLFLSEPVYLFRIDKSAADTIFKGNVIYFSPVKTFSGHGGRVGLFKVKY